MLISSNLSSFFRTVTHAGKVQLHLQGVSPATLHFMAAAVQAQCGRSLLLVVRDSHRAQQLYMELLHLLTGGREWEDVLLLPRPYISPYIEVSVDSRRVIQALGTLSHLARGDPCKVLIVPAQQLPIRVVSPEAIFEAGPTLSVGDEMDREEFLGALVSAGYTRVTSVLEEGTFAVRGSLVDLFSPGVSQPVRIDFFGDVIESMAVFSPETQMTLHKVQEAPVYPSTEVLELAGLAGRARKALLSLADDLDFPSSRRAQLTDRLRTGELPPGVHALLPILADAKASLLDYLEPSRWLVVYDDLAGIEKALAAFHQQERIRYTSYLGMGRLALPPERLFFSEENVRERLRRDFTLLNVAPIDPTANYHFSTEAPRPLPETTVGGSRMAHFEEKIRRRIQEGFTTAVTAGDPKDLVKLARLMVNKGFDSRLEKEELSFEALNTSAPFKGLSFFASRLNCGIECEDLGLLVATDRELFDKAAARSAPVGASADHREKLLELQEGDFVVHRDYGIGRFAGVMRKVMGAGEYTCLQIEYAQEETLYVPIHSAGVVQRYVGSGKATPRLDRLGSASWQNRVNKAKSATKKLAIDLLKLYARRKAVVGHSYSPGDEYFEEFEASFPYNETPDQGRAIEDVIADMERHQPMDRLVCGDVGFGKTEVAIRSAFKAILDGKQVAVLVPTTILAEQHRITFQERLKDYPVAVASLSRFKSKREQGVIVKKLEEGTVDMVIGTHRLLSKDIKFKSLGLIIVDEEHRFGVGHKEKLKALRTSVDVLSMTATPIPRTLHMAMTGVRDLSVIKTPPAGRLDIQTTLTHFDPEAISSAIRFELERGGQIFFLHNRVEDILTVQEQLQGLVPEVRILVAHGQMPEKQLEKQMVDFMDRKGDLLLCTTIIESGLDIPSVNTLIVNNADRFGLAQLYQIRGRVGRSWRQAFAYFIVPPVSVMSDDARARLATLVKFTQVGAGFQVASIDMELRGAGDILGGEQSGHVAAVGFDMYVHLLQETVEKLKDEDGKGRRNECRVDIAADVHLPEEYIPDRHQRLVFYRMIATAESLSHLEHLRLELRDRFGPIPKGTMRLLAIAELRLHGRKLGIVRVEAGGGWAGVDLSEAPDATLEAALALVKEQPVPLKVTQANVLKADFTQQGGGDPITDARRFLGLLEEKWTTRNEKTD